MNRRGFLGLFAGAASAFALDPEKLLWVPGAKKIFLPPAGFVPLAGNRLITSSEYARIYFEIIAKNLRIANLQYEQALLRTPGASADDPRAI